MVEVTRGGDIVEAEYRWVTIRYWSEFHFKYRTVVVNLAGWGPEALKVIRHNPPLIYLSEERRL